MKRATRDMTVREVADYLELKPFQVIQKLMAINQFYNVNQTVPVEVINRMIGGL